MTLNENIQGQNIQTAVVSTQRIIRLASKYPEVIYILANHGRLFTSGLAVHIHEDRCKQPLIGQAINDLRV